MYKALHIRTEEEIIILHPRWRGRVDRLREMDHAGELVCQGCRQEVRVKAGERKRAHFAHKHLQACSYGTQSPELLEARAVLYGWLVERFGERATLEKAVEGLPRPVDCWVNAQAGPAAFWIIENGIKLEPRETILRVFEGLGCTVHYICLSAMLREEKKIFHSLLLTPTERAFLQETLYDQTLAGIGEVGKSIFYLDAQAAVLTAFRGLQLHHKPNWFKGMKKSAPLAEVRAGPDGGFIFPGDAKRLGAFRDMQQRLERKRGKFAPYEAADAPPDALPPAPDWPPPEAARPENRARAERWGVGRRSDLPPAAEPVALPCVTCGQVTTDYWSTFYDEQGRHLCRCRECLDRGE